MNLSLFRFRHWHQCVIFNYMFNQKTKNNRGFTSTPNFFKKVDLVSGFTLVETMVAVLILSLVIISLMSVVASSLFASRYARDEIIANYLLQEAIDYVRNDRDTTIFLNTSVGSDVSWPAFTDKYSACGVENQGCYIDIFTSLKDPNSNDNIKQCPGNSPPDDTTCPKFSFDPNSESSFYNYGGNGSESNFSRKIVFTINPLNPDEAIVKVTVYWINGDLSKSRSLQTSLTRWQL